MSNAAIDFVTRKRGAGAWLPDYQGHEWVGGELPTELVRWAHPGRHLVELDEQGGFEASERLLERYLKNRPWLAPERDLIFLTDLHADEDAMWRSLVASGGIAKTGPEREDFELTEAGRDATIVIGGDLFDKGPANLPLLCGLGALREKGADLVMLTGNHDIRTYMGIASLGSDDPRHAHLLVRMGKKAVTLFKEVFEAHVAGGRKGRPMSDDAVRRRLYPSESWFESFPKVAEGWIPEARVKKELRRVREKMGELEARLREEGMSLDDLYRAVSKCHQIFIEEQGEFRWLFESMQVGFRSGSILFMHAGVDDTFARWVRTGGIDQVNRDFRRMLHEQPLELYNGPLGNGFRTKYRDLDFPLTEAGLRDLRKAGIYAIAHGHRNVYQGQRLVVRRGLLHFECDTSVDSGTRKLEGLKGAGASATRFNTDGSVVAVSTDHRFARIFDPAQYGGLVTRV